MHNTYPIFFNIEGAPVADATILVPRVRYQLPPREISLQGRRLPPVGKCTRTGGVPEEAVVPVYSCVCHPDELTLTCEIQVASVKKYAKNSAVSQEGCSPHLVLAFDFLISWLSPERESKFIEGGLALALHISAPQVRTHQGLNGRLLEVRTHQGLDERLPEVRTHQA